MRNIVILCLLVTMYVASATPIDRSKSHALINRPTKEMMFGTRYFRVDPLKRVARGAGLRKGGKPELNLRKGEYICGDRVCQLKPGEKPPCDMCQYPIALGPLKGTKY